MSAEETIDALRADLPFLFLDRDPPPGFTEEWSVLATDLDDEILDDLPEDWDLLDPTAPQVPVLDPTAPRLPVPEFEGRFPGAPIYAPWGVPGGPPPSPDALAFYLPFHYFHPHWWGVYVTLEGVLWVASDLAARRPCQLPQSVLRKVAAAFLYGHEFFHHKSEAWATRTEIIVRSALYSGPYEAEFRRCAGTDDWTEEAVAQAFGYDYADRRLRKLAVPSWQRNCVLEALKEHVAASPPGYRMGARLLKQSSRREAEKRLAEEYFGSAFGNLPHLSEEGWAAFPHAFTGLTNIGSRVNYLVRRGSPLYRRLSLQGRFITKRSLIRELRDRGCQQVRQGGRHEIWEGPAGRFPIPRHAGDIPRGTVGSILKQSGLGLRFEDLRGA